MENIEAIRKALYDAKCSYSSINWNGFELIGDALAIAEVQRLINVDDRCMHLTQRLKTLMEERKHDATQR